MHWRRIFTLGLMGLVLAACATPEQKAARAAAEKAAEQKLKLDLAAQCDARTAELMQVQMQNPAFFSDPANAKIAEEYRQKVNLPIFQSCYRLAWDNYVSKIRLQQARDWEMQRRWDDDMNWMMFRPRWCRSTHNGRSYVYRC
ncbi:hypothetical protein [Snodgrassella alvi]|uniref:Lipoprotein n=1 Tax=Snodgrassella alvi TaxID=1196083 RepID=A0A2N9WVA1_9NEIS|nr:hypothetical protein [Snodgrassella alvi]PIT16886.1 hypothetical protein BGI32_03480 [Snodgrassella alvi]PIT21989.1 hypothetical protein BGI34_00270 [Snodgrassella alvi]